MVQTRTLLESRASHFFFIWHTYIDDTFFWHEIFGSVAAVVFLGQDCSPGTLWLSQASKRTYYIKTLHRKWEIFSSAYAPDSFRT